MATQQDLKEILRRLRYTDDAKVVQQITEQMKAVKTRMAAVRHKLVVMCGKGGVGKIMTTVNLALALAEQGAEVGIIDSLQHNNLLAFAAKMPEINKPPIGLNPQELLTVISFIQSNGGKITVEPSELSSAGGERAVPAVHGGAEGGPIETDVTDGAVSTDTPNSEGGTVAPVEGAAALDGA
jgi:hypothetical protein